MKNFTVHWMNGEYCLMPFQPIMPNETRIKTDKKTYIHMYKCTAGMVPHGISGEPTVFSSGTVWFVRIIICFLLVELIKTQY